MNLTTIIVIIVEVVVTFVIGIAHIGCWWATFFSCKEDPDKANHFFKPIWLFWIVIASIILGATITGQTGRVTGTTMFGISYIIFDKVALGKSSYS